MFSKWTLGLFWICVLVDLNFASEDSLVENVKEETDEPNRHKRSLNTDQFNIPNIIEQQDVHSRQKRTVDGGQMAPLPMTSGASQDGNQDPSRDYQHGSGGFNVGSSYSYQGSDQPSEFDVDNIQSRVFVNPQTNAGAQQGRQVNSRQPNGQGQGQGQRSSYQVFPRRTHSQYQTQYLVPSSGTQTPYRAQAGGSSSNQGRTGYTNSGTPYYVAQGGSGSQRQRTQYQYPNGNRYYINPSNQGGSGYRTVTTTHFRTVNPVGGGASQGGASQSGASQGGVSQGGRRQGGVIGGRSHFIPNTGVISNNPNCPSEGFRVYIDNMECNQAVDTLGTFICYNYERVSRECCRKCLSLKRSSNIGCEYGDRSNQCRNVEPFLCYEQRNRDICCETCARYRQQQHNRVAGCEYGDLTPRCNDIRQRRHLCYLPENQRLCCVTCPRYADRTNPGCPWGDQSPGMCELYTPEGALRINCYQSSVREVCCQSCLRLQSRFRGNIPGCRYGDRPVTFSTPRGLLTCREYVREYTMEVCDYNDVATHCCYTCHPYRRSRRRRITQG